MSRYEAAPTSGNRDVREEPVDMTELLTVGDVARVLRVSQETVRVWLRASQLHGYNLGGRTGWRIPAGEVKRLLRSKSGPHHASGPAAGE